MRLKREQPCTLQCKVIQFGEGNFLRGFVDWMIDRLNKELDFNCGVTLIQPTNRGIVQKFMEQDGLFTLVLRGLQNGKTVEETTIVECIKDAVNPYADWDKYLELAKNSDYRFIISNTTESGIQYKKEDATDAPNITFPAKLTLLLKKRFDSGLDGFIIIPCELIDRNGDTLKEYIIRYANDWGFSKEFINWVENENHFTNTLVDRIVTGYPKDEIDEMQKQFGYEDTMVDTAEIFHLWVIEGEKKLSDEIPFHKIGLNVIWTDDVTPYKVRKVRILNGAHTMMVLAAHLAGLITVKEAMDDQLVLSFMKKGIFDEIIPTLDLPKAELEQFAEDVMERFANPYIKHYLLSIALNSVSKFKVRILPSILEYIKKKKVQPDILTFSLAALIAFYKTDDANDDKEIMEFMKVATVEDILKKEEYWGQDISFLHDIVTKHFDNINQKNIKVAMQEVLK